MIFNPDAYRRSRLASERESLTDKSSQWLTGVAYCSRACSVVVKARLGEMKDCATWVKPRIMTGRCKYRELTCVTAPPNRQSDLLTAALVSTPARLCQRALPRCICRASEAREEYTTLGSIGRRAPCSGVALDVGRQYVTSSLRDWLVCRGCDALNLPLQTLRPMHAHLQLLGAETHSYCSEHCGCEENGRSSSRAG